MKKIVSFVNLLLNSRIIVIIMTVMMIVMIIIIVITTITCIITIFKAMMITIKLNKEFAGNLQKKNDVLARSLPDLRHVFAEHKIL